MPDKSKKLLLTVLLNIIILMSYSQDIFDPDKFVIPEIEDSLCFDLDVDIDIEFPYTVKKINLEKNKERLIAHNENNKRITHEHLDTYGMYKFEQDSTHTCCIVKRIPDISEGEALKYGGCSFSIILFVYNTQTKKIIDEIVLAQKTFNVFPINSGNMIDFSDLKSTVYFTQELNVSEIYTFYNKMRVHPAYIPISSEINEGSKEYEKSAYKWEDGLFIND